MTMELEECLLEVNRLLSLENKSDSDWERLYVHYSLLIQLGRIGNVGLEVCTSHYCSTCSDGQLREGEYSLGCSGTCYTCSAQCFKDRYGQKFFGRPCLICDKVIPQTFFHSLGPLE